MQVSAEGAMTTNQYLQLVAAKLETLRSLGDTGMLWWVSSSALVAAILGAVWLKREAFDGAKDRLLAFSLSLLVWWFIASIVYYGVRASRAVNALHEDVRAICRSAGIDCANLFQSDFSMAYDGYRIGTSTFVIALIAWSLMTYKLVVKASNSPSTVEPENSETTPTSTTSESPHKVGELYVEVVDERSEQEGGVPSRVADPELSVGAGGESTPDVESDVESSE
jgi:hypothetical protein